MNFVQKYSDQFIQFDLHKYHFDDFPEAQHFFVSQVQGTLNVS